jgi:predicted DNA-binding protein
MEVAKGYNVRLYKKHRAIIKKLARKWKRSQSTVIRDAIEDMGRIGGVNMIVH